MSYLLLNIGILISDVFYREMQDFIVRSKCVLVVGVSLKKVNLINNLYINGKFYL